MKKILAIAVATAISAPAMADLTIGGSARYQADTGTNGEMSASTNRVLVAVSGSTTAESGAFVAAKATLQLSGATANTDGDNSITLGNEAANVVLGYAEPAGAFNSGVDAFQNSSTNKGYEGVTAQVSTDLDVQDDVRLVLGTSFGDLSATLGVVSSDDSAVAGAGLTVGTTVGGVALNASYAKADDDASSMNVNASYNGFTVAIQNDETNGGAEEQEVYGGYVVTDAAGLAGLNVTAGFGHTDSEAAGAEDTKYGVRLDYTF